LKQTDNLSGLLFAPLLDFANSLIEDIKGTMDLFPGDNQSRSQSQNIPLPGLKSLVFFRESAFESMNSNFF